MRRGRITIWALTATLTLMLAAPAAGATSRDIYRDLADNGRLDGVYTAAELKAALQDPSIQGYGAPPVVAGIPPTTETPITPAAAAPPAGPGSPAAPTLEAPGPTSGVAGAEKTTGVAGEEKTVVSSGPLTQTAQAAGQLPFTGTELTIFALVGLGLVASGLLLRSTGRRSTT